MTQEERKAKREQIREIEDRILRAACEGLIGAGYLVQIDNGEEEPAEPSADVEAIMGAAHACDQEQLRAYRDGKNVGSILLTYGESGWDVICDYHTSLEPALARANAVADEYAPK